MRSPLGKYSNHIHFKFKGFNFLLHMLCIPQSFTMALLSIPFPRNGEAVLLEIYFQSLSSTTYYITSPFLKSSSCFLTSTVLNFQGFFFSSSSYSTCNIWKFPGQGSNKSHSCQPALQPHQHWIRATSGTYAVAQGLNTSSWTLGQGLKPMSHSGTVFTPTKSCLNSVLWHFLLSLALFLHSSIHPLSHIQLLLQAFGIIP